MDALGELLLNTGDGERAYALFERSAKLAPDMGATKWLYLGQLSEGWQSLQHFSKGAELLQEELGARRITPCLREPDRKEGEEVGGKGMDDEAFAILNQLVSTHCSIADLYLTDLCFEEDAEARCQAALDEALRLDVGGSPEVTQACANLRLSQKRGQEAAALMIETVKRLGACQQDDVEEDDEEEGEGGEGAGQEIRGLQLPTMMFRLQTAKLLLECQAYNKKCAKEAVRVLEACKCEDDENVEVWYLLGVAYSRQRKPDVGMAKAHLLHAQQALRKMQQIDGDREKADAYGEQLRLVEEQLEVLRGAEGEGIARCETAAVGTGGDEPSSQSSSDEDDSGREEMQA
jgi:tetratricopeptide (TPR) repeat protein